MAYGILSIPQTLQSLAGVPVARSLNIMDSSLFQKVTFKGVLR